MSEADEDDYFEDPYLPLIMPQYVDNFLKDNPNPKNRWLCKKCEHFLVQLKTKEQILKIIDEFRKNNYQCCKRCRAKNYFDFAGGHIRFLLKN